MMIMNFLTSRFEYVLEIFDNGLQKNNSANKN